MSKGIYSTAEFFSTFRTKHNNIGLQSKENSNVRYRRNKQKKAYIEWRCFLDKSHKCKAKFFSNLSIKDCWNLKLDHICGSDLLGTQQAPSQYLKNKIKGKTPSQEKSNPLLGTKRPRELKDHFRSEKKNQNVQNLRKYEKKHLEKLQKLPKNVFTTETDRKESQESTIKVQEVNQENVSDQCHIKDINASKIQIMISNSSQSPDHPQCRLLNPQSTQSHYGRHTGNDAKEYGLGDDQSRSDFINFQSYSNQIQTDRERRTSTRNLPQSQQPTRESSNSEVQNSPGETMIQIATANPNPERYLQFNDHIDHQLVNQQYLIAPKIGKDITLRIIQNFSGTSDQPNNGSLTESSYITNEVLKGGSLKAVEIQDEDSLIEDPSVDYFLKGDDSSSDPYISRDYDQSHNFWNSANVEENGNISQRRCQL